MADTHETIADIIAEKRRDAQHIRNNLSTVPVRRLDQLAEIKSLADEADRIEAAHKRDAVTDCNQFSDAAKLREALKRIVAASIVAKNANAPEWILQRMADVFSMATTALAAPPRNCDRFKNADEAIEAVDTHCEYAANGCIGCPAAGCYSYDTDCRIAWLFAPATEQKGGNK